MPKIKIVSDPYRRSINFLSWNNESWSPICAETNPNSALLGKQLVEGFLPFKAHKIVEKILAEYGSDGSPTEIEFEGADDEWSELMGACSCSDLRERVRLVRGGRSLANARDILPFVRSEFEGVSAIISGSLEDDQEAIALLDKFHDASSDVVPICVVGNYSSGKSTFINALIGVELLPSSDKPLTARVYRIERSEQPDRARVEIDYMGSVLSVELAERGAEVHGSHLDKPFARRMAKAVADDDASPIECRARVVLSAINGYRAELDESIGSLVSVKIPYEPASWMRDRRFVIFDTPGSNSNSNADHLRVLQEAMRGMSNGLPVYVTEYSAIDSNDNADLYDEIKNIEALDERFSMIIVNKADAADLSEDGLTSDDYDYVMNTAVTRNLYAQGVFFVSSVMGLGAKLDGNLSDRHYDRLYRQLLDSYQDPEDRFYTRLYDYDIMPAQLKNEMVADANSCDDTVLANSGLYSVECGIEDFATKYSVYNKCFRADALLHELISRADVALEDAAARTQEAKQLGETALDEGRASHLSRLEAESEMLRDKATSGYASFMDERDYVASAMLDTQKLVDWEEKFSVIRKTEERVDEKDRVADAYRAEVGRRLGDRFSKLIDNRDILGLGDLAASFMSDVSKAFDSFSEEMDARHAADKSTSEDLLARVREHFEDELTKALSTVEQRSKDYWEMRAQDARNDLLDLVSSGDQLDDSQTGVLRVVILNFRQLDLVDTVPDIIDIRYPFDPNKLWKAPLALQHNLELARRVSQWRAAVGPAHEDSFFEWLDELTNELGKNIVGLNPELRKSYEFIRKNEAILDNLTRKRERLRQAEQRVSSLMDWRGRD